MAYFCVKHKNKSYINRELLKDALGVKDKDIDVMVAKGELKAVMILDEIMYEHETSYAHVQNLDEQIANFVPAKEGEFVRASGDTFFLPGSNVPFVKIANVHCSSKYNKLDYMPIVKVCGTLYAAMFHKKRNCESPIVIVDRS